MIRQRFIDGLLEEVGRTQFFLQEDFEDQVTWKGNTRRLSLVYRHNEAFSFLVDFPSDSNGLISVTMRPGDILKVEQRPVDSEWQVQNAVREWLGFLESELKTKPMGRFAARLDDTVQRVLEQCDQLPDEVASAEEVVSIEAKLDSLKAKFEEELKQRIESQEELESRLGKMQRDVEFLKATLATQKKAGWMKSFVTRVASWGSDSENQQLLKDGAKMVRGLLTDGEPE